METIGTDRMLPLTLPRQHADIATSARTRKFFLCSWLELNQIGIHVHRKSLSRRWTYSSSVDGEKRNEIETNSATSSLWPAPRVRCVWTLVQPW